MTESAGKPVFRFVIWLARRLGSGHEPASRAVGRPAGLAAYTVQDAPTELVTVRLPDGRVVAGRARRGAGAAAPAGSGRTRRSC